MKQTTLKQFLVSSINLGALTGLILLGANALACAGGDECDDGSCNSIFSPEVIGDPSCTPFFRSNRYFYLDHDDSAKETRADLEVINAQEWAQYFSGVLTADQVKQLVYQASTQDVANIAAAVGGKPVPLATDLAAIAAQLADVPNQTNVKDALTYLNFAKRCEPLATSALNDTGWLDPKPKPAPTVDIDRLMQEAQIEMAQVSNRQLVSRYRFQILRLMFYGKQYSDAYQYYDKHQPDFATSENIQFRAMEMAAGALYKDKQYGRANYLFATLFNDYPPLKKDAFQSFHPQDDKDWKQTLALARTNKEKIALWAMFGIYADGFEAIRQIYAIYPQSSVLSLLLVREVNKAEESFQWDVSASGGSKPVQAGDIALIKQITDAGDTAKPYVWALALGHLYGLQGDSAQSAIYLQKAGDLAPNSAVVQDQIRISALFSQVHALRSPDATIEDHLAAEMNWLTSTKKTFPDLRGAALLTYVKTSLAKVYAGNGQWVRALLLDDSKTRAYFNNGKIDEIQAFLVNKRTNSFDAYLIKNSPVSVATLNEMKGVNSAFMGDFKSASSDLVHSTALQMLRANPFTIHINDCHDCDADKLKNKLYTKASFTAKMQELETQSRGTGPSAAQASFLLANGYYNMSHYGNARDFYQISKDGFDNKVRETDMGMAERYYRQARNLSTDPEFRAKVTFMLAKCEQNRYFNTLPEDALPITTFKPGAYFQELKADYAGTNYFQEIIKECGYFKTYLGL